MSAYTVISCAQRSQEWFDARCGRLTGSAAADAVAFKVKGGETADRAKLRGRLIAERLTGRALDDDAFVTAELRRGIEMEKFAVGRYEAQSDRLADWSGFLSHNTLMVGCSLDGHVSRPDGTIEGIIEIKCPKSTTHLAYLLDGGVPAEYLPQATHNLWVSGADWLDFVSFDDRFTDERLQFFKFRITREQVDIAAYVAKVTTFLAEVDAALDRVLNPKPFIETLREAAGVA